MVKEDHKEYSGKKVTNPYVAQMILENFFEDLDREMFIVLCLDASKHPTGINIVAVGSLTSSIVVPREVFKPAILCNAASIIVAHNHPSGNIEASRADKELTKRLVKTGRQLGIEVNDHIIFGDAFNSLQATNNELFNF